MGKAETGTKGKSKKKESDTKAPVKSAVAAKPAVEATSKVVAEAAGEAPDASAVDSDAAVAEDGRLPATHGKVGVFGGPRDRGIKADDKLALPTGRFFVYERVRSLNPKSFYCAMRWDYHLLHKSPEEGKRWWANKKLLITNSKTGTAIVARAVDYGPHENTGLDISVSPGAAEALGVEVGDEVDVVFADQKAPLGPVE